MTAQSIANQIKSQIRAGQLPAGSQLPTTRDLAEHFKSSRRTVMKALDLLSAEGLLLRKKGSGIYVTESQTAHPQIDSLPPAGEGSGMRSRAHENPNTKKRVEGKRDHPVGERSRANGNDPHSSISPSVHSSILPSPQSKADFIANHLIAEISRGNLRCGNFLPVQKSLAYQYKASMHNVRKALVTVEAKGLIHRKGSSYVVGPEIYKEPLRDPDKRAIYLIGNVKALQVALRHPLRTEFMMSLEKELSKYGISHFGYVDVTNPRSGESLPHENARGYVFVPSSLALPGRTTTEPQRKNIRRILQILNRAREPVVIFDYDYLLHRDPGFAFDFQRHIYPFAVDDINAGESVARYLTSLGHRQIAYFTFYIHAWAQWGLQGFKKAIRTIHGSLDNFHVFSGDFDADVLGKHSAPQADRKKAIASMKRAISERYLGYRFSTLVPWDSLFDKSLQLMLIDACRKMMAPKFDQALKNPDITAWACADQTLAVVMMDYLRKRRIQIPEQISLIGIDEDQDVFLHGVTTYNYGAAQKGYLAAHCILGDIPVRRDRKGIVECPGQIVQRGSVGRRRMD